MFKNFSSSFRPDTSPNSGAGKDAASCDVSELSAFFSHFGGMSFNSALYRILEADKVDGWNAAITAAYSGFIGHINCFGFDWLGRIFALNSRCLVKNRPGVVMFEPGTGEVLEIPCNLESFHEDELINYRDAALAENFYLQWLNAGGDRPSYTQCVGYKRPLFLGGVDTIDNLELTDLDVYWTISAQLISKLRGLPPGTRVDVNDR
ncbi:T6SS immunity protein Tdi1 domain-containing protein [Ralstonia solanacearum]|uniref:T6SS immunity protein Tdi1 domain-containing protein n=1 Tax=Ralstonia solanacearum TaxID=305 RepID=UPI0009BD63D9|nr:T6SS immunity protein Tdi1 domain-containing protein [Ralstonia solanacearum]